MTEDEIVGWHHRLNGCEFEQTPGDSEGQGNWHAAVHEVAKSQTQLSKFTSLSAIRVVSSAYIWVIDISPGNL